MNIYCLSKLFAGILYNVDTSVTFTIERYCFETNTIFEATYFSANSNYHKTRRKLTFDSYISNTESLLTVVNSTSSVVLHNMEEALTFFIGTIAVVLICLTATFHQSVKRSNTDSVPLVELTALVAESNFRIEYIFDAAKNALQRFSKTYSTQKNILIYPASDVEMWLNSALLRKNWSSSETVYSQSLDFYLSYRVDI